MDGEELSLEQCFSKCSPWTRRRRENEQGNNFENIRYIESRKSAAFLDISSAGSSKKTLFKFVGNSKEYVLQSSSHTYHRGKSKL